MRAIAEEASLLVAKYKGAFSGEHGDGLCRGEWIAWQFGPALTEAFRAIKNELDPGRLFNPGRIVDPPRMDDATLFRFPPPTAAAPYRTIALVPALDWSAWDVQNDPRTERVSAPGSGGDSTGGFAKAVEMCNNNGHCRKFDAGTMCPSFRVTRDEEHLTRGRANTLRLALSGQLGADALTSEAVHDAMDLCVSCKGCKRECPTGVDMARMKIEVLAHYKKRHGYTLKDRLIAHLPDYAACGEPRAVARQPARARSRRGGARRKAARPLGPAAPAAMASRHLLARPRPLAVRQRRGDDRRSPFRRQGRAPLRRHLQRHLRERERARRGARAAGRRLHAAHARQSAAATTAAAGPILASGMVDEARAKTGALVDALLPFAAAGVAIVGLEPSCLLTLRDEALVLGLGAKASTVAGQALLFEEFIAREAKAGRFEVDFTPLAQPILVHGHCHQKAFAAVTPILDVLRLVPGAKPELIETSCCGMAGSFGYEASHHDVSLRMAEASLLPAIRKVPEAIVVADGTSCRQQIADGAGREALHVARLLERCLPGASR